MAKYKIGWMPGDGVGVDVMDATKVVLDKLGFDPEAVVDVGWCCYCNTADDNAPGVAALLELEGDGVRGLLVASKNASGALEVGGVGHRRQRNEAPRPGRQVEALELGQRVAILLDESDPHRDVVAVGAVAVELLTPERVSDHSGDHHRVDVLLLGAFAVDHETELRRRGIGSGFYPEHTGVRRENRFEVLGGLLELLRVVAEEAHHVDLLAGLLGLGLLAGVVAHPRSLRQPFQDDLGDLAGAQIGGPRVVEETLERTEGLAVEEKPPREPELLRRVLDDLFALEEKRRRLLEGGAARQPERSAAGFHLPRASI